MAVTFERLAGSTSAFAIRIALEDDPNEGRGSSPDEASSWGSFQLWVRGKNLCLHTELGETVESVHWYLLPFLEWIAREWDPLFHEHRLPLKNAGSDAAQSLRRTAHAPEALTDDQGDDWFAGWQSWWSRHAIRAARDGGLFPNVQFRRWQADVEVSWDDEPLPGAPEDHAFSVTAGNGRFSVGQVASPLFEAALQVARVLQERTPISERLHVLVQRLEGLSNPARYELRAALLAGMRADQEQALASWRALRARVELLPNAAQEALLGALNRPLFLTRPPAVALMFGAAAPTVTDADVTRILGVMTDSVEPGRAQVDIDALARDVPLEGAAAWREGRRLALEIDERLGLSARTPVNIEEAVQRLGVVVRDIELDDQNLRGLSLAGPNLRPVIAINSRYRWQSLRVRRLVIAHEMAHLLFDRTQGVGVAVASGPWAPVDIERRANTFGVYLLLPLAQLSAAVKELGQRAQEKEGIEDLATRFEVSGSLMYEELHNRGFLSDEVHADLAEAFHWSRMQPRGDDN